MKERILYYQTIMKRDENEITRLVVCRQKERKLKGDFYPQVLEDMKHSSELKRQLKVFHARVNGLLF